MPPARDGVWFPMASSKPPSLDFPPPKPPGHFLPEILSGKCSGKAPEKRAQKRPNGARWELEVSQNNKKRESRDRLQKRHRKSAEKGTPGPSKMMVSYSRGHKNHKMQGSGKCHRNGSEIEPNIDKKSIKCLPGAVPENHRKKLADKLQKQRQRAPKMEPIIHQKSSKNRPWGGWDVCWHTLASNVLPEEGHPPQHDTKICQKNNKKIQKQL